MSQAKVSFINDSKSWSYRCRDRLTWYGTGLLFKQVNILRPQGLEGSKAIKSSLMNLGKTLDE